MGIPYNEQNKHIHEAFALVARQIEERMKRDSEYATWVLETLRAKREMASKKAPPND